MQVHVLYAGGGDVATDDEEATHKNNHDKKQVIDALGRNNAKW